LEKLQLSILSLESCGMINKYLVEAKNALVHSKVVYKEIKSYQDLKIGDEEILTRFKIESLHKLYNLDIQTIHQSCEFINKVMRLNNSY
jgi:hypothetical protein